MTKKNHILHKGVEKLVSSYILYYTIQEERDLISHNYIRIGDPFFVVGKLQTTEFEYPKQCDYRNTNTNTNSLLLL